MYWSRKSVIHTGLLCFVFFVAAQTLMAQGTYYPPVGTQVTCWDNREFLGQSQRPFSADPSPQAVGSQLLNRISSIKVPRGLRVTLIDSNNPNEPDPRRRVTIYPGYYPYIGQWEDRTDFILVEEIDPNEMY